MDPNLTNPELKSEEIKNAEEQKNLLFFNVMPKQKNGQILTSPTQTIANPSDTVEKPVEKNLFSKHKVSFILIIAVIILAIPGYFIIKKLIQKSYAPENLLVTQPSSEQKIKNNSTSTPENAAFPLTTPSDWQLKYFGQENCQKPTECGDEADPDLDGLTNLEEYQLNTDPNNKDSDQDGLADGDEVHVFETDPLNTNTAKDLKYNDVDYIKGAYDIKTSQKMTANQIKEIKDKMDKYGLHQPTLTTLADVLEKIYGFGQKADLQQQSQPQASSTGSTLDQRMEAKQDRDAQRTNTIKNIGIALVNYFSDNKVYPKTQNFKDMFDTIKPYIKVATNPQDPINQDPFVYTYTPSEKADDFTLTFYSETANQIIKKRAADAQKDKLAQEGTVLDDQRQNDLESLRTALLLYSNAHIAGNQDYVFPSIDKYKTDLVPDYISVIPKDPKTKQDYEYQVSTTFDTFTLKVLLDNPATGTSGYLCNQEECRSY